LGEERCVLAERISQEHAEAPGVAETRLWTAMECLKKAGVPPDAPLVLESIAADGWALFRSGNLSILSCVGSVAEMTSPIAIAVAVPAGGLHERASVPGT
jgi:enediyne polyketide synthase